MISEDVEVTMKVIAVGNGRVGKTSLITSFATDKFIHDYKKTLGVDFLEKHLFIPEIGQEVVFHLWDTAGQEEYDAMTRGYYKGANAAVLVFSTTDRPSFDSLESWYKKVREECGDIYTVLVQNKVDLLSQSVVSREEVEALALKLQLRLYRCCVKEGLSVGQIFHDVAIEGIKRKTKAEQGNNDRRLVGALRLNSPNLLNSTNGKGIKSKKSACSMV